MFTRLEIKSRLMDAYAGKGTLHINQSLHPALLIATCAHFDHKQWNGVDYAQHFLTVALEGTESLHKIVIGFMHDVIEDSQKHEDPNEHWTLKDLEEIGFPDRVIRGVDSMTQRPGELYFDYIERLSLNTDAVDKKMTDLQHNMQFYRNHTLIEQRNLDYLNKLIISKEYLAFVKQKIIEPGTPMASFIAVRQDLFNEAVLDKHSSHYARAAASLTSAFPAGGTESLPDRAP